MNLLIFASIVLSVLLGVGRAVDLACFTDPSTGLCLVGSVWLRYAALGVTVGLAALAGRIFPCKPQQLCKSNRPAAAEAALSGVLLVVAGVLKLFWGSSPVAQGVGGFLTSWCGAWLLALGQSWRRAEWKRPTESLTSAVLGSAIFYWGVLARFMENSSSWHRVGPTATVWQMLAALVFLSALVRALYLPETSNGRMLCAGGLCSFALCLCWELPELLTSLPEGVEELPDFFFGLGLCGVGAMGLLCVLRGAGAREVSRHSVG